MLKSILGGLRVTAGATLLLTSLSLEAKAEEYKDFNRVSNWADEYVEQLTQLGCFTGYPDGEFKPTSNITRQELAVVMAKCLETVEANNKLTVAEVEMLKKDITILQARLDEQDKKISEQANTLALTQAEMYRKRDNWVGVGIQNGLGSEDFNFGGVSIDSKLRVINFNETLGLSFRPGFNTASEAYAGVTLDMDVSDNVTLYGGAGAAVAVADDFFGVLTNGTSGDVTPYAQLGGELDLTRTLVVYTDVKIPLEDVRNDFVSTVGFGVKF